MRADSRRPASPDPATEPGGGSPPSEQHLRRAIAVTVLYADLFDYALTEEELFRRLIDASPARSRYRRTLDAMVGEHLRRRGGFITWKDRTHLERIRKRRGAISARHWNVAERYGRWLRWIPFIRMVAVSGALAQENAQEQGDVDLFCITDPDRLWLARLWLVPLARWTRAFERACPLDLCPNYILTTETLEVDAKNLFTAYETVQAVPLWGEGVYRAFRAANPWTARFLPQTGRVKRSTEPAGPDASRRTSGERPGESEERPTGSGASPGPEKPWPTRAVEWLLGGRLGDHLDRALHRLSLHFFRRRAVRSGWDWSKIRAAYRRNRYTVPMGGYARVVERLLGRAASKAFPDEIVAALLDRLFPDRADGTGSRTRSTAERPLEATPERERYAWERIFARDYSTNAPTEPAEPTS